MLQILYFIGLIVFVSPTALAVEFSEIRSGHFCENRGSLGGADGRYSWNVGPNNPQKCAERVSLNSQYCGQAFNYGMEDGWCDCVPVEKGICEEKEFATYSTYHLNHIVTIKADAFCSNRGSSGEKDQRYSTNVGANNLYKCAEWVRKSNWCGRDFNYGKDDGYCDCVPSAKEASCITDDVASYGAYRLPGKRVATWGPPKAYAFGGNGGNPFVMQKIQSIGLRGEVRVDALTLNGVRHGGKGGTDRGAIQLQPHEYIREITVSEKGTIHYLKVTTNLGQSIEAGRKLAGAQTHTGIFTQVAGRSGGELDQIVFQDAALNPFDSVDGLSPMVDLSRFQAGDHPVHLWTYNITSNKKGTLNNANGEQVNCTLERFGQVLGVGRKHGENLTCEDGLKGRIRLKGMPEELTRLKINGQSVTEIVAIDVNSGILGAPNPNFVIDMVSHPNMRRACPYGKTEPHGWANQVGYNRNYKKTFVIQTAKKGGSGYQETICEF